MAKRPKANSNPPKAKPNVEPQARNAAARATGMDAVRKALSYKGADALKPGIEALTAAAQGLPGAQVLGVIPSPIEGGDGNKEFLIAVRRG